MLLGVVGLAVAGAEHRVGRPVWSSIAVLQQRRVERRAHLDGPHAGVGLRDVARDQDPPAGEVEMTTFESAELVDPQAGEHQDGERRVPRHVVAVAMRSVAPHLAAPHLAYQHVAHAELVRQGAG